MHYDQQIPLVSGRFFQRFGEIVSNTPQRADKLSDEIKDDIFHPERKHSWVVQLAHTLQGSVNAKKGGPSSGCASGNLSLG